MAIQRFRTIEEMTAAPVVVPPGDGFERLARHCAELGRPAGEVESSQQAIAVIATDDGAARDSLDRAKRVYGPRMTEGLEEHGLWGSPERITRRIRDLVAAGCTLFVIEFFGKDPLEPARFFAREVAPAFR